MTKGSKFNRILIDAFKIKIAFSFIVLLFPFHVVAPVYLREIQCLAVLLKPEECQKIVLNFPDFAEGKSYFNSTQCFQKLANWTWSLKLKQRDVYEILKNRLRQIEGRVDLVSLIHNCFSRFRRELSDETIDDWGLNGDKKETTRKLMSIPSATLSKIDNLLFGVPRLKSNRSSSTNAKDSRQRSGLGSKLKLLMNISPRIKSHSIVRERANEIDNSHSPLPESSPFLRFHPVPREDEEKSHLEMNYTKREKEEEEERERQDGGKFHNLSHEKSFLDSKSITSNEYPCLRLHPYVVLGIVGFIGFCACCCTLIIRRKIVSCLNFFKPKKKKKKSPGKYIPIDAESGQETPRKKKKSFSLISGKKKNREPSKILINTATQDSNASVLKVEEELTPTGCCQCCKKKRKKGKKRKK